MIARAASLLGAVLSLVLLGTGTCRALSLRSSAAEVSLGDVLPGNEAVAKRDGARPRVENTGSEPIRLAVKAVPSAVSTLKDGWEAWPYPERVRVNVSRAVIGAGEAADLDVAVKVPAADALRGGQYQFDVLATGTDSAGASLTLKVRALLSVGAPLPQAAASGGKGAEKTGFALSPSRAALEKVPFARTEEGPGAETTVKLVNAGDEEMTVTLSPARDWDETVRPREGYEPAPNPRWLRLEPGVVKIRAGAIGRARIWTSIPREARYAGRRWSFAAAADAESGGRRTRLYFVLDVTTPELEETPRAR